MPIELDDDIKQALYGARDANKPMTLGYVGLDGAPHLSLRGGVHVYGPDQLAIWVRNPEGGFVKSIEKNTTVALLYADLDVGHLYSFVGRARVEAKANDSVWEGTPPIEKGKDPERKGMAVIVDLDLASGVGGSGRFQMTRDS